ncbi:MAG: nucleotidyl transferase AbiEii/AbiGii toxin family protein [Methylococcales bacterium]
MTSIFSPHLDILQPPQRRLWDELAEVPQEFILYGGTAIALHLGHRKSVDFDFFGDRSFNPEVLYNTIPFLSDSIITQMAPDTLTCLVDRNNAMVQVSFFGLPRIRRVAACIEAPDNGLKIAALIDLAGMKAAVVQKRAEAKDYLDIDTLIQQGGVDLASALAAAKGIYGKSFVPELTLKALSYFGDGDLKSLPRALRDRLTAAVRGVDLDKLPMLASDPDLGEGEGGR